MAYLDDIGLLITTSAVAGGATGWPLYLGHLPDSSAIGDKAVAVLGTAGFPSHARVSLERPGLQVLVRGEPINQTSTGYQDAEARAVLIDHAIHAYVGTPDGAGSRVAGVWNESGPAFAGFDESERPMFSANYRVWREST